VPDVGAHEQVSNAVTPLPGADAPVAVPRRRRLADLLAICFVVVAIGVAGWALRDQLPDIADALRHLGWWRPMLALALVIAGLLATAEVWKHCLAALGSPVSSGAARRIFFPAQVGKYLPGSVWPFLAQIRFAREFGVPGGRALLAGSIFLVVHTATSVLVGALLLISQPGLAGRLGWLGACLPAALVLLHPKLIRFLSRRLAGRADAAPPVLRASALVRPVLWMVPAWVAYGAAGFLLAEAFTGRALQLAVACTAAFALGWLVGLLVFVAPAGVGAREGILVLALTPIIGLAEATTVSVLLRVVHTLADVLLALGYGIVRAPRNTAPTDSTATVAD
jgi:glycosyltransferase 2 family protein